MRTCILRLLLLLVFVLFGLSAPATAQAPTAPPSPSGSPSARVDPRLRFDLTTYYGRGTYSNGGAQDTVAFFLQYALSAKSRVWLGHTEIRYADRALRLRRIFNSGGAYVALDGRNALQADYFAIDLRPGGRGEAWGMEYFNTLSPRVVAGLGFMSSRYPAVRIWQVAPRVVFSPSRDLSLHSRVFVTRASGPAASTRVAFMEKVNWRLSPQWTVKLGGAVGSAWRLVDNDISTIYVQPQPFQGSVFAAVHCTPDPHVRLFVHGERDWFAGYRLDSIVGGGAIRW